MGGSHQIPELLVLATPLCANQILRLPDKRLGWGIISWSYKKSQGVCSRLLNWFSNELEILADMTMTGCKMDAAVPHRLSS